MPAVEFAIPPDLATFLRETIRSAGGNEVYFLGRVEWEDGGHVATLREVDVVGRGHRTAAPAILQGAEDWDIAIHNHPSGRLDPSDADIEVASELGNRGVGFAIIDNTAERHYLVVKPFAPERTVPVEPEEVRRILGPEGPFAASIEGFEWRHGQVEMAVEVAEAFQRDRVVACEAGTGVGKSFAYLVPAILWAVRNRGKVVVSTGTIHLQEQLVHKDLPLLTRLLPVEFEFALIKGRGNYACRRKLDELPHEFEILDEGSPQRELLESLLDWSKTTEEGSLADLTWTPPAGAWEKVMSETDKSLKVNCEHYERCFFYRARRRANSAHIVVANHHLFFADLAVRRQTGNWEFDLILPKYSRVVFDEAHHLEDVASEHLGSRFSRIGVRQRLGRMRSRDGKRGTVPVLARRLRKSGDPVAAEAIERRYGEGLLDLTQRVTDLFDELDAFVTDSAIQGTSPLEGPEDGHGRKARLRAETAELPFWNGIRHYLTRLRGELETVVRLNDEALNALERSRLSDETRRRLALDLEAFGNRLESFLGALDAFCDFDDSERVRWIETRPGGAGDDDPRNILFASAPISVADTLREALFDPIRSAVLTSATLSVADRPSFLAGRLGFDALGPERFRFRQHASPFSYERQALLTVPTDMPLPGSPFFEERLAEVVLDLLIASQGRAFVLFTSYALLRRTHQAIQRSLVAAGFRPLAQGEAPRSELLRRFVQSGNGVLFGTDSFWEGVDVKGEALGHVILTRLPFRVPTEPLQEARLEEIETRGENAFAKFTVPQAVLRFKQGFGRLIRSSSDRGVVSVLDRRLLTKPYGKTFLASLPPVPLYAASTAFVSRRIASFFAGLSSQGGSRAPVALDEERPLAP